MSTLGISRAVEAHGKLLDPWFFVRFKDWDLLVYHIADICPDQSILRWSEMV